MEQHYIDACISLYESAQSSGNHRSTLREINKQASTFKAAQLPETLDTLLTNAYKALYELYFSLEYKEDLLYRDNSNLFETLTKTVANAIQALKSDYQN